VIWLLLLAAQSVQIDSGAVRGQPLDGGAVFRGIPFAAPPVGSLRFSPPAPAPCWQGALQATSFGQPCLQRTDTGEVIGSEDCLTLNVWGPDTANASSALPVLVFIHGGGHQQGSTSQQLPDGSYTYDGQRFVERASAIVQRVGGRRKRGSAALAERVLVIEEAEGARAARALEHRAEVSR